MADQGYWAGGSGAGYGRGGRGRSRGRAGGWGSDRGGSRGGRGGRGGGYGGYYAAPSDQNYSYSSPAGRPHPYASAARPTRGGPRGGSGAGRGGKTAAGGGGGKAAMTAGGKGDTTGKAKTSAAILTAATTSGGPTVVAMGDNHSKRLFRGPTLPPREGVTVQFGHEFAGGGLGGDARSDVKNMLSVFLMRRCIPPNSIIPEYVAVSLGGNAITVKDSPQTLRDDVPSQIAAVAENLRWFIYLLGLYGAPGATVFLVSPIPRAHLSDVGLTAFRQLADAQRAVAREFQPRCVFLDVERLVAAERAASGSWRGQLPLPAADGPVNTEVAAGSDSVWSLDPLPPGFPKPNVSDFGADGVNLDAAHYLTIRAAVEEYMVTAAVRRVPPHPPLPTPPVGVICGLPGTGDIWRSDDGGAANGTVGKHTA